ncbi:MFS general substrate transporter [Acephala macrosclerotiorum]|nr:MFS general substrate transporter [Acephala macrosclerotiorum]
MAGSPKTKASNGSTASENTPLLGSTADDPPISINEGEIISNGKADKDDEDPKTHHHEEDKPLPKLQIFLLCYARMIEPIAFFGIFPFINKMIFETGTDEEDVGFYSGLIESLFSATQMLLMISWGRAADRIGRKPVLVFSLAGVSVATAVFGMSKTVWQMILFRCSAGVFAGTVLTVRTMLSENSTPKTQARAFSLFAFAGNVGIFAGPLIGGGLADPAEQIGGFFKKIAFFHEYPYSLSTFCTGIIGASAAIACALFIKETLDKKPKGDGTAPAPTPMTTMELLRAPGVGIVLALYGHVMLLGLAYTAVSPVFWFTSPEKGGYGFTPIQISMFLGGIGISQGLWLLVAFPILHEKFGTGAILRVCYILWPMFFVAAPMCNLFLRWGGPWRTVFWIVGPTLQIGGSGVPMAFTCVQLALNDIAPTHQTLGTLNGIALTLVSGIRTVGPALFASLFATGARSQFINGYLVWVVLILVALPGTIGVRWLPKKSEGKIADDEE